MRRWRKEVVAGSSSGKLEVACRGRVLGLRVLLEQVTIFLLLVQLLRQAPLVLLHWRFLPGSRALVLASVALMLKHLLLRQAPLVLPLP